MNTSPQGKAEENNGVPWRIAFTRKDLLAACWNNGKMADLLYHFLHVGSCTIKNNHLASDTQVVVIQDTHTKILAKVKLSEPTLISFLKVFTQVGYVRKVAHKKLLEVDFTKIEQAFTNPPEKPIASNDLSLNLNIKNEQAEEVQKLSQEVKNLTAQVQDLSLTLVSLKVALAQFTHEFKFNFSLPLVSSTLNKSSESAQEASSDDDISNPLLDSKSNRDRENRDRENGNSAIAPLLAHTLALVEDNFFFEDTPEQANFAYSHDQPATTTLQACPETSIPAASDGYTQESKVVDPPSKPDKPASRQRKPKVEQPVLVDTSKKAVAFNEAEQRVFDWYCGCDFIHAKPEQDANKKKHCGKLALHVHSQEEMQSLADFTKTWVKEHFKQNVYVVPLGNMAYSDTLNVWIAKQKQAKRVSEPAAPQEIDLNKPVLWTRYQHTGPAIKHWFLYEDMPFVEAQQYGYKADVIVPNDRRNIRTSLKALAEGHQTLTPEEQNEKDHAELRLHLVA